MVYKMVRAVICIGNIMKIVYYLLLVFTTADFTITAGCVQEKADYVACIGLQLSHIPDGFDENLITLILTENHITALEADVLKQYLKIETLKIDYNFIQTPADLQNVSVLPHLRYLDISNNLLDTLDFSIFHYNRQLETIEANNNFHLTIHDYSEELPYLVNVSLRNCTLEHLPLEAFKGFTALQLLDLRDNRLIALPEGMAVTLLSLKTFLIVNNPIKYLDLDAGLRNKTDLVHITENKSVADTTGTTSIVQHSTTLFSYTEPKITMQTTLQENTNGNSPSSDEDHGNVSLIASITSVFLIIGITAGIVVLFICKNRRCHNATESNSTDETEIIPLAGVQYCRTDSL